MRRAVCRSVVLAAACAGTLATAGPALADSPPCDPTALVCLQVADTPDPVSVTTSSSATYIGYTATVINQRSANRTHLTVSDAAPAGTTLVSAVPSTGTCTTTPSGATCALGSLQGLTSVTVTFTLTAPTTAGNVANPLTASWDENTNDSSTPDPKQDGATQVETTAVSGDPAAATYLPVGLPGRLSTDPTGVNDPTTAQNEILQAAIPPQSRSLVARLNRAAGAFACPRNEVCRSGDWMQATIPGAPFDPALRFTLHWDATVVPKKQNTKNLAVFYSETLGGTSPLVIVDRRCSSASPATFEMPCLYGVAEEPDGDFSAVLIQDHNGYMR